MATNHPYFWTRPEAMPSHLPEGEQWQQQVPFKVFGAPSPHPPQTAPGYQNARRMGLLPPPAPTQPPTLLPGPGSLHLAAAMAAVVISCVLVMTRTQSGVLPQPYAGLIAVSGVVATVVSLVWLLRAAFRRSKAEAAAGYTLLGAQLGLWRLSPLTGEVKREPDRAIPPTGWYPSPYWPGVMQWWDGPDWKSLTPKAFRRDQVHLSFKVPESDFLGLGNVDRVAGSQIGWVSRWLIGRDYERRRREM